MQTKLLIALVVFASWIPAAHADDNPVTAVKGVVEKVDTDSKTIVLKSKDGTEHTLHYADSTMVRGAKDLGATASDTFHGIRQGSEVVAHYTANAPGDTVTELDKIGKGGLRSTKATIVSVDRDAKTMTVKAADGTEKTYALTDDAAKDGGRDIANGAEKGTRVTIYYAKEGGKDVAHFFEKI